MEPESSTPILRESTEQGGLAQTVVRRGRASRRRRTPDSANAGLDREVRLRLGLQRRAPRLLVQHLLRAARRVTVLVAVDLASFYLARGLLRSIRDQEIFGRETASVAWQWMPPGILSGWQYAAALLVGLTVMGSYGPADQRRDWRRLFFAAALATALPMWMSLWTNGVATVALEYTTTTLMVWLALGVGRTAVQQVVSRTLGVGHEPFRTLFVGEAAHCRAVQTSAAFSDPIEHESVGFADTAPAPAADAVGSAERIAELLHQRHVEVVVVCDELPERLFEAVAGAALTAGCELLAVPREHGHLGLEPRLLWRAGQPLLQLTEPRLRGWELVLKRVVDLVGSVIGLILAAPAMAVIAVAIRFDSPGPVFFRQLRVGAGGSRFHVLKFRTMRDGASQDAHREYVRRLLREDTAADGNGHASGEAPVYKLVGDDRITPLGRWLRKTSLDEIPQLINVLLGDMSLVGPRPPLPYEIEVYEEWQFERLGVKPGITGLWQVSGRNRLTYRRMCELDAQYVRTWSLLLDLQILARTVPVVLTNSGKAS